MAAQGYRESVRASGNLSATSAIALLLTFALGAVAALGQPTLAVAAAVGAAVLLDLRSTLHSGLRLMEHRELRAALQMLVLTAVVLPLLPDAAYGPYGALNPARLWWAVVLIAGLSLSGHVAMRLGGAQRGLLWTGLLGGLASSTAATVALARRTREQPALLDAAAAGAVCACAVMFGRIAVVLLTLAPALGLRLLVPLAACGAVLLFIGLRQWRRRAPDAPATDGAQMRPFDLTTALGFGAFLGAMAVLAEASKAWFGVGGLYALALLSGLADVDAITVSIAGMARTQGIALAGAAVAIGAAVLSNLVAKAAIARITGGPAFGRHIARAYAAAALAGALALTAELRWG